MDSWNKQKADYYYKQATNSNIPKSERRTYTQALTKLLNSL
ncbi:hypothetical protein GGC03_27090 (plasmid) [Vibrio sp. THAF191c]|nr:hypothetical protein FIU99_27485 [Vibrio sp. THAF64]QGM37962.1 hypothetical protein GGC04_27080 [Vibrio sp. THAF191d]QGN73457.1 hypothetical protein GGC03_27090 [Vibrio sp. THAF191c]